MEGPLNGFDQGAGAVSCAATHATASDGTSAFFDAARRAAVEDELMTLWGHINAATARFLELLAEFDRHEGWSGAGITSCAHWPNVFCGIGTVAAREKVRAMTRIATPPIEAHLLDVVRHGAASHMARLVRHFRSVERRNEAEQAEVIHRERYLRTYHDEDGTLVLQARLPAEVGAIVVRAIEAAMAIEAQAQYDASAHAPAARASIHAEVPEDESLAQVSDRTAADAPSARDTAEAPAEAAEHPDDPIGARRADALALLAEHFLADQTRCNPSAADRYQILVHIDQALLAGTHDPDDPLQICELEHGPRLALETARRLACDASLLGIVESENGAPLDVGRKTRSIPPALRRALNARDRGCRFPGCERHRHTHAHHIDHWADGGATKLDNLVTLCPYHHRLLHEGGFAVTADERGELVFMRPDGTPVLDRLAASRFRGSARSTALAAADREIADLIAINTSFGRAHVLRETRAALASRVTAHR